MSDPATYIQQAVLNKARKDKFVLVVTVPDALKDIKRNTTDNSNRSNHLIIPDSLQFSVVGVSIPAITIPSVPMKYAGMNAAVSSHNQDPFDNVTVNFNIDNRFNNYHLIQKWLNLLCDFKKGNYDSEEDPLSLTSHGYDILREYTETITLYGLDEFDTRIIQFEYLNAFPVQLGGIQYNYTTPDEIESSFTFAFNQMLVNLIDPDTQQIK